MSRDETIYDREAERYAALIGRQPSLANVLQDIRPYRGLDALDVGAGTGRLAAELAPEVRSLICTDNARAMLDELERRLAAGPGTSLRTAVADHRSLPVADGTVDLAVSGWSLCYLAAADVPDWEDNLRLMMAELHRVVRPGGTIIVFETLGTGFAEPVRYDFLAPYFSRLETRYGFRHRVIPMDYTFADQAEAEELTGFFFGEELAAKVRANRWTTVPEFAGVWYRTR